MNPRIASALSRVLNGCLLGADNRGQRQSREGLFLSGFRVALAIGVLLIVLGSCAGAPVRPPLADASSAAPPMLPRDFTLPLPLFAPTSAWNQLATEAAVLPESDQQILVIYRVLRGDTTSLYPPGPPPTTWPFMDVNYDEYSIPVFRVGEGEQDVLICDYEGRLGWPHPKFGIDRLGGPVTVPAPAGSVRPSGPPGTEADGHLVLYDLDSFTEYDYWNATTRREAPCASWGGGYTGTTIFETGVVDFFSVHGPGANLDTYYSARATGVPLLAGLILPEDVESGAIAHALAVAIPGLRNTSSDPSEPLPSDYFYPASTTETDFYNTNPYALAAGQRLRLKQTIVNESGEPIDESQLAPITRMFLTALRTYGAYLVDNADGFSFYAEDIHTANLHLTDAEVNVLLGRPPDAPLPAGKTKWQLLIEKLNEDLEQIPFAYGPWTEGQDPATAQITVANFEVVEPAIPPDVIPIPAITPTVTATPTPSPTPTATGTGGGQRTYLPLAVAGHRQVQRTPTPTAFAFPDWAREARLVGASFDPEMTDAEIEAKLQQLADQGVSVVVADAPTGWSYTAWVDDAEFNQVLTLMRDRVFPRAHAKGLRVVWYLTGLELICEGCVQTGRDPAVEHPQWVQIDRFGNPVRFSNVQGVFWLNPDDIDVWLSPESPYRDFYIARIRDIAAAGADGLWMDVAYLLNSIGPYDDLWPSYDPYSRAAFQAAYGHSAIPAKNWSDLAWRHFVRWRIESITRFVEDVAAAARAVNPNLLFFTENWGMDSNYVTQYAQDPLEFLANPYVATAHELEPVDQDDTGMANATLKQWRDYALMVKFAVAANKGKPGWVLTYAGGIDDSLREAGVHLAEGANFYEAKGPEMVDDSTGSRPIVFPWLAANAPLAYHSTSMAEVALWYSPRTRDFIDGENAGDDKYDYASTTYIREYRARAQDLLKAQVPFDIVTGQWSLDELRQYAWLVLPDVRCLSDAEVALLRDYVAAGGKLAVTGSTGAMDEWCQPRVANALAGVTTYPFSAVTSDVVTTDLSAYHKRRVLIEVRTGSDADGPFVLIPLVNFDRSRTYTDVGVTVRLPDGFTPSSVAWNAPDAAGGTLTYSVRSGRLSITLPRLKTAAMVIVRGGVAP